MLLNTGMVSMQICGKSDSRPLLALAYDLEFCREQITEQHGTLVKAMFCRQHSGHNKYVFRLQSSVVWYHAACQIIMLQRNLLPPSSKSKQWQYSQANRQCNTVAINQNHHDRNNMWEEAQCGLTATMRNCLIISRRRKKEHNMTLL